MRGLFIYTSTFIQVFIGRKTSRLHFERTPIQPLFCHSYIHNTRGGIFMSRNAQQIVDILCHPLSVHTFIVYLELRHTRPLGDVIVCRDQERQRKLSRHAKYDVQFQFGTYLNMCMCFCADSPSALSLSPDVHCFRLIRSARLPGTTPKTPARLVRYTLLQQTRTHIHKYCRNCRLLRSIVRTISACFP